MDLAPYCYQFMFYDCASLTMAPELPATIIAAGCYFAMFRGCASLKIRQEDTKIEDENFIFTCPTLLTDDDVLWMFEGCTCTGFTSDPQPEKSYY
ncbi:MAG: hypothetical protein MJ219_00500 [Mycoplasmoidaceae bacterium]|nr:hypothetical protein [Mycoplasmoidaceae bacterium]